jgi:transcriptional regulator GlxA family with amidase domain
VVLVPGGHGRKVERDNTVTLDFLRRVAPGCTWVTSVCTGAFVLEAAGLLPDHRVTTHWASIDELRDSAPHLDVLERTRYVQHGKVVTAAGVSAGIDMSLWLLGQLTSVEHARTTQYLMEYDPAPPYSAVV